MASSFNLKSWIGRFLQQPHNYFILAALNVLVLQLSFWSGSLMIVTSIAIFLTGTRLIYFIAFCLFLCWGVYKLLNRFLINRYLSWVHAMITILVVFIFIVTHIWVPKSSASDGFQADMMGHVVAQKIRYVGLTSAWAILLFSAQLLFPINLILGLRHRFSRSHSLKA